MTTTPSDDAEHIVTVDIQQASEPAFVLDMHQRVVAWNRAAEHLLGRRAEEAVGQRCFDMLNPNGAGVSHPCRLDCPVIVNARRNRPSRAVDAAVPAIQGSRLWVTMTCSVVHTTAGHKRLLHVLRDTTRVHDLDQTVSQAVISAHSDGANPSTSSPPSATHRELAPLSAPAPAPLTPRESQVLRLLVRGLSTSQIAEALGVSRVTARNHVTNLMGKLNAPTRLRAVVVAAQMGLLSPVQE